MKINNEYPLISIIIPTYNRGKYLPNTIKSIIEQNYKNWELFIVDDGSTDNTKEIIGEFTNKDSRIHYLTYQNNRGANYARNLGIKESKGGIITFNDSDTIWLPHKLEKQIEILTVENTDVVFSTYLLEIKNGKFIINPSLPKNFNVKEELSTYLLKRNIIGTPALMLKKECFEKCGYFSEELPRFQDWDLALLLAGKCNFAFINEPLFTAFDAENRISNSVKKLIEAREYILSRHYKKFSKNPALLSNQLFYLARSYCRDGNIKKCREKAMEGIKVAPLNLKNYIVFAITIGGKPTVKAITNLLIRLNGNK